MKSLEVRCLTRISLLGAMIILLALTPLGYIPLGPVRATTIHIPVLLGGILLGWRAGAGLGALFGLTSLLVNTFTPTLTSFVFTPFYRVGEFGGNGFSLIIAFVPRILIGVGAAWLYRLLAARRLPHPLCGALAGAFGSMVNTVLVMGGIYLFFGASYAQARGLAHSALAGAIGSVILVNGVPEAIAAGVLTAALVPVLKGRFREEGA